MASQGDPHRVLGVAPGATLDEIRSAYRRLVKRHHPDTAGERALPRFLEVQAAYERLVDGDGRLRPGPGSGPPGAREPRRADEAPGRATREAWRARQAGRTSPGTGARPRPSGDDAGTGPGSGAPPKSTVGDAGPGSGRPSEPGRGHAGADDGRDRRHGHPRGPRRATPGSTTYDEATEHPRSPSWSGAAWYGPTSGTYWTVNPREYADPRKHGPEYQARARRAAGAAGGRADESVTGPTAGRAAEAGARKGGGPGAGPDPGADPRRGPRGARTGRATPDGSEPTDRRRPGPVMRGASTDEGMVDRGAPDGSSDSRPVPRGAPTGDGAAPPWHPGRPDGTRPTGGRSAPPTARPDPGALLRDLAPGWIRALAAASFRVARRRFDGLRDRAGTGHPVDRPPADGIG